MIPSSAQAQPTTQLPLNLRARNVREKTMGSLAVHCGYCGRAFRVFPSRLKRLRAHAICCSQRCAGLMKVNVSNARFVGQVRLYANGYNFIPSGLPYVKAKREHARIVEKALGRKLKRGEIIHHINLDKTDNRPSNLLVCTQSYHAWLHQEMARRWVLEHLPPKPTELVA